MTMIILGLLSILFFTWGNGDPGEPGGLGEIQGMNQQ
jgi:hypothetical protein